MRISLSVWGPDFDYEAIYKRLVASPHCTEVVYYAQQEWEYIVFSYFNEIAEICAERNIPFRIVICVSAWVKPLHDLTAARYRTVTVCNWGTFWLTSYLLNAGRAIELQPEVPEVYTYPFVCMNAKPHVHRCRMVDLLEARGLLMIGAVSWLEVTHDPNEEESILLPSIARGRYIYRHWTPRVMRLTEPPGDVIFSFFNPPMEYYQSFMQLLAESQGSGNHVMSEKTFAPVFHKKPFLVLAGPGHYELFKDYGFLLYDELFDYSFDSEPDIEKRTMMIIDNVERIRHFTQPEFHMWYQRLLPKIEHNYNLAVQLATDINQVPDVIRQAYADPTNSECSREIVNFITRYECPK